MEHLDFSIILFFASIVAGVFGALSGLGGGIVIVPLLVLGFQIDTQFAIGASLIAVIATSSGASVAFLNKGITNLRVGLFLETATVLGAIIGAYLAVMAPDRLLHFIFGLVLIYSVVSSFHYRGHVDQVDTKPDKHSYKLHLGNRYPVDGKLVEYRVHRIPLGWSLMLIAGALSGMLGIGSGAFNVLALQRAMTLPFKVATTTSNFIIGVTAAASAGTFLHLGYISPPIVMPLVPGVLIGSFVGAKILMRTKLSSLQTIFSVIILAIGLQMIYSGVMG